MLTRTSCGAPLRRNLGLDGANGLATAGERGGFIRPSGLLSAGLTDVHKKINKLKKHVSILRVAEAKGEESPPRNREALGSIFQPDHPRNAAPLWWTPLSCSCWSPTLSRSNLIMQSNSTTVEMKRF